MPTTALLQFPLSESFRLAFDLISDVVLLLDPPSFRLLAANHAACSELGYLESELSEMWLGDLALNSDFISQLKEMVQTKTSDPALVLLRRKDNSTIAFDAVLRVSGDADEQLMLLVCRKRRNASAPDRDWLTGIAGRATLESRLQQMVDRQEETHPRCAVFFIDLDGFKDINDKWGHSVGDIILRTVAHRLAACIRPTDLLARYGGDEFMVVLKDVCNEHEMRGIAERMQVSLQKNITYKDRHIRVSASIGIAISAGNHSVEELIEQADRAMYLAKAKGRSGVRVLQGEP